MSKHSSSNVGLAVLVIVLGVVLTGAGIWALRAAPQTTAQPLPTVTATWIKASLPTATATHTATPTRPVPTPSPTPPNPPTRPVEAIRLTIIQSNDTWGYTRPCG